MSQVAKVTEAPMPAVQQPNSDDALVMLIDRMVRDPTVDPERIERFLAIRAKEEMRKAEQHFNSAKAKAQAAIIPVAKNKRNTHTNSNYADMAAIADAALPVVHSHGFGMGFCEFKSEEPNCIGIRCELVHEAGFSRTYDFNIPIDAAGAKGNTNKTPVQAYGSTTQYGRRYATCMVWNIATKEDNDGNAQKPTVGPISDAQVKELSDLVTETKTDIVKFLAIGNIESLSEITTENFTSAKGMLMAKKQKMAAEQKP